MDTPAYFKIKHLIDISVDENIFGYSGNQKTHRKNG